MATLKNSIASFKDWLLRRKRIYPLSEVRSIASYTLLPTCESLIQPLTEWNDEAPPPIQSAFPALRCRRLETAIVHPGSNFVVQKNSAYIQDCYWRHILERASFNSDFLLHDGHIGYVSANTRQRLLRSLPIPNAYSCDHFFKCIPLFGNGSKNWYHWMTEVLPKAWLARFLPPQYDDYSLLIPDYASIGNFGDSLNCVTGGREVKVCRNTDITISDCLWIDTPSMLPFEFASGFPSLTQCRIHTTVFKRYIESILNNLHLMHHEKEYEKIFLKRNSSARTYNQDEVEDLLIEHSFTPILQENLSFSAQLSIWQNTKFAVGPTGAAWTNVLFSKPNRLRGLVWCPSVFRHCPVFTNLAALIGNTLNYLFYEQNITSTYDLPRTPYTIKIAELLSAISKLSQSVN